MDPVAFRLQNLTRTGIRDTLLPVMNAVLKAARWQPKVAASRLQSGDVVTGRGFAMYYDNTWTNSQAATVADVSVKKSTGKVVAKHIYSAVSSGLIVNPALVENQISGAMGVMASRTLVEQVGFSRTNVTSVDWASYPILRFADAPAVTPVIVQRPDLSPLGAGEPVTMAAPAAIANAIFDATGVRMREAPFTPARVRAILRDAGAG
jgi:CO/xanthine dehydrogenase Mo-binding subunit